MPPWASINAAASSRENFSSVPVNTNVMPAKRKSCGLSKLSILTPASRRRVMRSCACGLENQLRKNCAVISPMSSTAVSSSTVAFISRSMLPKVWARTLAALTPICRIPRAQRSFERSFPFDFSMASTAFCALFAPMRSSFASASTERR